MKSRNIPMRIYLFFAYKARPKAQIFLLYIEELQPQISQRHHKYQQGKEDSWDTLRKATSITKRDSKRKY
jgi:hypothetical protein